MREQGAVLGAGAALVEVDDQHTVVADPGEHVPGIARHQAGAHPADLAAPAFHLEFGAPAQRHHQLMVVVGMGMRLVGKVGEAGFEHGVGLFKFCALYSTSLPLPSLLPQLEPKSRTCKGLKPSVAFPI
ncbi:hypothetical protein D3C78_1158220 [compost metagenome]